MKTIALTSAVLMTVGLSAGTARADYYDHIHDLAESLQAQSAATARDIYYHLREAPDFVHLYNDSLALYRQTEKLHLLVDNHASPRDLDRQIHLLEDTQKHIAELVEQMEKLNLAQGGNHRHVHFHPPVNQYHLERVCNLVTKMGQTIDHMHSDVAALLQANPGVPLPPGVQPGFQPVVPAPPAAQPVIVPAQPQQVFPQSGRQINIRRGGLSFSMRVR